MPELWPSALAKWADAFQATLPLMQMMGPGEHRTLTMAAGEDIVRDYIAGGWHMRNPRVSAGMRLARIGHEGFVTERQMLSAEQRARDPFQQEFARKYELTSEAGRIAASHEGMHLIMTIQRGVRPGPFSGAELQALNRLANGLSPMFSMALRLKLAAAAQLLDTLEGRGGALGLLSTGGRILHMTGALEQLVGHGLQARNGRLSAEDPSENRDLQALFDRAAIWPQAPDTPLSPVVLARHQGRPLIVHCIPVAGVARDILGLARMVVAADRIALPKHPPSQSLLRNAFGLTPAEARLAGLIGQGTSVREAADVENITFETARSRLKSIYTKTETGRQSELALLVSRFTTAS